MSRPEGRFCWYELLTSDPEAAGRFYEHVVGWSVTTAEIPDIDYRYLIAGGVPVGGILPKAGGSVGGEAFWLGYIQTADVDASAGGIEAAGGVVHRAPDNIPGIGRFAVVADPQGAIFVLFAPGPDLPDARPGPDAPGTVRWHELQAKDGPAAFDFYADRFGWTKDQAMDMGELGVYQLFAINGAAAGGMWTSPAGAERPFWLYYFNVEDIDAGKARVEAAGGKVEEGPHEVPGGAYIIQCRDLQNAKFALVGPRT